MLIAFYILLGWIVVEVEGLLHVVGNLSFCTVNARAHSNPSRSVLLSLEEIETTALRLQLLTSLVYKSGLCRLLRRIGAYFNHLIGGSILRIGELTPYVGWWDSCGAILQWLGR